MKAPREKEGSDTRTNLAAGRATGSPSCIVRIPGDAGDLVERVKPHTQLRRVADEQRNPTGLSDPHYDIGVMCRSRRSILYSHAMAHPLNGDTFFNGDRQSQQRLLAREAVLVHRRRVEEIVDLACLLDGRVETVLHDRVEQRIHLLASFHVCGDDFLAADLS